MLCAVKTKTALYRSLVNVYDSKRKDEIMNEAKIAVTIAALLITGAFGSYAFKNLDTDDIVTDKITTVETVKEVTPEEDMTEDETVELTDTAEDTQAKEIYLEHSQSSIRSTVVHIEYDDCVYADEEPAEDVQPVVETEPQASQAEVKNNESKAQAPVTEDSEASQNDESENISVRYEYFNADVSDPSTEDSSEDEDGSSYADDTETESEFDADESSEGFESEELAEDEDSEEEEIADSFGESDSTEESPKAEDSVAEENDDEMTESEEETPGEEENSAEDEESSESEESSEGEESAEEDQTETSTGITVTQSEYYMLCNVVAHEYGSDWVSEYDKALVVEVIMNRVNSPKYPNSIYDVLTQPYQFSGMQSYITLGGFSTQVTESVKAAVDLYLSDPSQFNHGYYSFWGDGYKNHFY